MSRTSSPPDDAGRCIGASLRSSPVTNVLEERHSAQGGRHEYLHTGLKLMAKSFMLFLWVSLELYLVTLQLK